MQEFWCDISPNYFHNHAITYSETVWGPLIQSLLLMG